MVYQSMVASTLFFAVVRRGDGIKKGELHRLKELVRNASSVVRLQDSLDILTQGRINSILEKTPPIPSMAPSGRNSVFPGEKHSSSGIHL